MQSLKEKSMQIVFLLAACISIVAVALICIFMFANGIPAIGKIGLFDFPFGDKVETSKRRVRHLANDSWQYICNCGSYFDRRAYRNTVRSFYGSLLSKKII